jgi:hypothetical protein
MKKYLAARQKESGRNDSRRIKVRCAESDIEYIHATPSPLRGPKKPGQPPDHFPIISIQALQPFSNRLSPRTGSRANAVRKKTTLDRIRSCQSFCRVVQRSSNIMSTIFSHGMQ